MWVGGTPPGHAPFGESDADFQALMFHDADPRVVAAVTAMRNPEPCGDDASLLAAIATDVREVPGITVPVLLVIGDHDAVFPPPALQKCSASSSPGAMTSPASPSLTPATR